ncbi:MAG: helix-turn-helix domain-containing protein [Bacteroidales bacterium]|jgi:transcriptional regulator with XRE-family HTH domain|nr:helix-turn-helix domain-containing protein [Bacteroidales bacterium]
MNNILENIIALRYKSGLSQENMAEFLGISQSTYSLLEKGKRELKYSTLLQIAIMLRVNIIDIITYPKKYVDADQLGVSEGILEEKVTVQIELKKSKKDKVLGLIFNKSDIEALNR